MKVRIVSASTITEHTVAYVECFTPQGNLMVFPGHDSDVAALIPGSMLVLYHEGGKKEEHQLKQAVLDIERDELVCLEF